MTMLYSLYSSEGIIFAADSRITRPGSRGQEPPQHKVIRVSRVGVANGLIGYYGLAQIKGVPMATWLSSLIASWSGSREPEDFADFLVDRLNNEAWARERSHVSGFHFGAFRRANGHFAPMFFHIINTHGFDQMTGLHTDPGDRWRCEDHLMGRDVGRFAWNPARIRQNLRDRQRDFGMPHWYRNGDMPVFGPITGYLDVAVAHVVRVKGYGAPTSLNGWERIAHSLVVITSQLARAYYKGVRPTIGDKPRVLSIEWPRSSL